MASLALRAIALIGNLAILLFALLAIAAYQNLWTWFLVISAIGFVVVNLRIFFPWPLRQHDVVKSYPVARAISWAAVAVGLPLGSIGLSVGGALHDWWLMLLVLAGTGMLNIFILRMRTNDSAGEGGSGPHA